MRTEHEVLSGETFADRMALAFLRLTVKGGDAPRRIHPAEFGELIGARLDGVTVPAEVVISWFAETVPDLQTIMAIAEICGVDPGWLAFGNASKAPTPSIPRFGQPHQTTRQPLPGEPILPKKHKHGDWPRPRMGR